MRTTWSELVASADSLATLTGNQVGVVNPGLGTLTDNGGPTQTIALLLGSAAINAGGNALAVDASGNPLTTDQRGFSRMGGGTVDIGAFEVQMPVVSPTTLPDATYGTPYSQTIMATATGGAGVPYAFAITGGMLPAGLILTTGGVLSGKPTIVGSFPLTVTATDSGGFTGSQAYTIMVNAATLTITPTTGQSKFYGAAVLPLNYTPIGFVNGDTNSLLTGELSTTATMASPVGDYAITLGTLGAGSNYMLTMGANLPPFAVNQALLTITPANGTIEDLRCAAVLPLTYTPIGFVNGDTNSLLTGALSTTATMASLVGDYAITLGTLGAGSNYMLTMGANLPLFAVNQALLTVSGITASDKVYDATTAATLVGLGTATLDGFIVGDTVNLVTTGAIGTFASKDVGNGVSVVVSGLTISGAQAFDYALIPPTTNAEIIARTLTASLTGTVEKTYDGTVAADLLPGNFILSGVLRGDNVVLNDPATAVYVSKNAGNGKTISVSGLALIGPDAADYQLSSSSISGAVGEIRTAALTITAKGQTKVYGAAIQTLTASYSGLVNGDTPATFTTPPTLSTTASTFSSVIAGGYPITASGAIDPNYTITYVPGILSVTRARHPSGPHPRACLQEKAQARVPRPEGRGRADRPGCGSAHGHGDLRRPGEGEAEEEEAGRKTSGDRLVERRLGHAFG